MDGDSRGSTSSPSEPQEVEKKPRCTVHQGQHSAYDHLVPEGCNICAGSARIDSQPSVVPTYLSDILCKQQQVLTQPQQYKGIHHLPFEILSTIFVWVKEVIIDLIFEESREGGLRKPHYRQPSQSPPLLVGAVSRKWRAITLATPMLWTDIVIDLAKNTDGQFNMIQNWATRSGVLPLDIIVFESSSPYNRADHVILSQLRSLAVRWNDVGLSVTPSFCYQLFNDLPETPSISTLILDVYGKLRPVKLQHPLCPKRLLSPFFIWQIPFKWDRVVLFDITYVDAETILRVIEHAPNLRHCIANSSNQPGSLDNAHIINHSLIFLRTQSFILERLTLPSLLHLHCIAFNLNSLIEFVDRSCAPLHDLIVEYLSPRHDPVPSFESLPGITSLSLTIYDYLPGHSSYMAKVETFLRSLTQPSSHTILPRLNTLRLEVEYMSDPSWDSLCLLWTGPYRRKLSKIVVYSYSGESPTLSKTTLLNLLEARASGLDLIVTTIGRKDLFRHFADLYGIEL